MPEFINEFQDFVTCRRETIFTLASRYQLIPLLNESDDKTDIRIRVKNKYYHFNIHEIRRVLKIWRSAAHIPAGEGSHVQCHKVLVKELQKNSY